MKTYSAKKGSVERKWYVVDATDKILGRMATEIAHRLRGKHKPEYTPHADVGDFIVVINADKIKVTGNKAKQKVYYRHTGYPGGIKSRTFSEVIETKPEDAVKTAVKGMLPKNPLGRSMFKKLKVVAGSEHEYAAQQPQELQIG